MKLLEVKDLKTYFTTSRGKAKAVDGVYLSTVRHPLLYGNEKERWDENHADGSMAYL